MGGGHDVKIRGFKSDLTVGLNFILSYQNFMIFSDYA